MYLCRCVCVYSHNYDLSVGPTNVYDVYGLG